MRITGLGKLPSRSRPLKARLTRCQHCGELAVCEAPTLEAAASWARVAATHAEDCPWVAARGWRVSRRQLGLL